MATILRIESELTGNVTYRAQVRVKGRPPESQTFSTRKKAESWAKALESAIEDGRHFPQRKSRRTLFVELVNRYRASALKELPAVSAGKREQHLDWWLKRFGGRTLGEITPDLIAEARDALAAETFTRGKPREVNGVIVPPGRVRTHRCNRQPLSRHTERHVHGRRKGVASARSQPRVPRPVSAPEIEWTAASSALILLAGAVAVVRSRSKD